MEIDKIKTNLLQENMQLFQFHEFLSNIKPVLKILSVCNIPLQTIESIEDVYFESTKRAGAIYQTKDISSGETRKIIIDIIDGSYNSYQQLLDVTFNHGRDCDYRIIMFNVESVESEYEEVFNDFVKYINRHGMNIYKIEMESDLSAINLLGKPPEKPEFDTSNLPELRQFQNAEFWQFYYYPETILYPLDESEKVGEYLFERGHLIEGRLDISFTWNEEGAMFIVAEDVRYSSLKKLLDDKLTEIKNKYAGKNIIINRPEKGLLELKIIYDDRSVNDFYHLSLNKKISMNDLISEEFYNFYSLMDEWSRKK